MQLDSAKLRTYSSIKTKMGMKHYLTNIHNITDRISMSTFRLSNHLMTIEVGRHKKMERHDRKCPFCPYEIEDEIHFLTTCTMYSFLRNAMSKDLSLENVPSNTNRTALFKILMTDQKVTQHTARYVSRDTYIREFLIAKHRNDL